MASAELFRPGYPSGNRLFLVFAVEGRFGCRGIAPPFPAFGNDMCTIFAMKENRFGIFPPGSAQENPGYSGGCGKLAIAKNEAVVLSGRC